MDITLIILCAGESSRFNFKTKKQWLRIKNKPLWLNVADRFKRFANFKKIVIVGHKDELKYMKNFNESFTYVEGGKNRQESLKNALKITITESVIVTDVARANVPKKIFKNLIKNIKKADCIVPVLSVSDTVIYNNKTLDRDKIKLIQTPQLSNTSFLKKALDTKIEYTDDSSAIKALNGKIFYIKGSPKSKKITFGNDIKNIKLKKPKENTFTGIGYDTHKFEKNKPMYLGGEKLPFPYGFKAHSDGDVLIHSLIDSLLGAIGAGDIGEFFPDNNQLYKDIDSKILLKKIINFIEKVGYEIINIDILIIAEIPKINPFKEQIKKSISKITNLKENFINIKATTSEKMGFIGNKEGLAVQSCANLKYYNWKKNEYTNNRK